MNLTDVLFLVISILLVISAFLAVNDKHLIKGVLFLSLLSMLTAFAFLLMHAPDVALTEAVIGSGLITGLFVFTLLSMSHKEVKTK